MGIVTPGLVAFVSAVLGWYFVSGALLWLTQDSREPPALATTVPFITPLIGMIRHKTKYTRMLWNKQNFPIYTLRLPFSRIYVVNSAALITAVQRHPKILAFQPIEDSFAKRIIDPSDDCMARAKKDVEEWQNAPSSAPTPSHVLFKGVAPGEGLDGMNRMMIQRLQDAIGGLAKELGNGKEKYVDLHEWIKHEITMATTEGVYGEGNPYRDPKLAEAFWKFEEGLGALSMGVLPNLLAKTAVGGRNILAEAFEEYFTKHVSTSSSLTKGRHEYYTERGFTDKDIAKTEVGNGIAILSNTVPTAYWFTFHLFSKLEVLEACRKEALSHVVETHGPDGLVKAVDVSKLKTSSPILLSAFKEAMRVHSIGVGIRMVMQDHMLANQYLLKKGCIVIMPAAVQHFDSGLWGSDVASYNHERFVPDPTKTRPRVSPVCFRGFGGGTTLCPGRHFATTEVLVFVTMLMLRFTVEAPEGWKQPTTDKAAMSAVVPGPDSDFKVVLKRRPEDEGVKWIWSLTGSDEGIKIAAEDMEEKL
ncbi:cytochrome P450 [Lophiotrema nucula]|uniref:Cytochrome P450 n=1 Tax=Lophiotrema nucula TaxID=690887 RepID=A0A6A5ZE06_9PLEO|nr:cytochrome P450 [Lophiotrema nucula]